MKSKWFMFFILSVLIGWPCALRAETADPAAQPISAQDNSETESGAVEENTPAKQEAAPPSIEPKTSVPTVVNPTPPAPPPATESELLGCVQPLKALLVFYQNEIKSGEKLMSRWNNRVQGLMKRQKSLQADIDALNNEIDTQEKADSKKNKKTISSLRKQLDRLQKDEKNMSKEMQVLNKELINEINEVGKGTQAALQDQFQQIKQEIDSCSK